MSTNVVAPNAAATAARTTAEERGAVVETRNLVRDYAVGGGTLRAVDDVSLRVEPGQLVAVRGRSGSGKTTLLSLIGALDRPTTGSVHVAGLAVSELPERQLVGFRR